MALKETIAIIANQASRAEEILRKLPGNQYRFLVFTALEDTKERLSEVGEGLAGKEIEFLTCMKDACWESDLVILDLQCSAERKEASELIQEVSVQKVVICFEDRSEGRAEIEKIYQWLPHSKVVVVQGGAQTKEYKMEGRNSEALAEAGRLLGGAGFQTEVVTFKEN